MYNKQQTASFSNHDAVRCFTVFPAIDAVFQIKSAILQYLIYSLKITGGKLYGLRLFVITAGKAFGYVFIPSFLSQNAPVAPRFAIYVGHKRHYHDLHIKTLKMQLQAFCSKDRYLSHDEYERVCVAVAKSIIYC